MKIYGKTIVFAVLFMLGCVLTGFQCGSTEMTSAKLYLAHPEVAGNLEKAEAALEREVAKNPGNSEAWFRLGQTRYELKKYIEMGQAMDQSLKAGSEFSKECVTYKMNAWSQLINKGVAQQNLIAKGNKDSTQFYAANAQKSYLDAVQLNPDSAITYEYLAITYSVQKNYPTQIAYLTKARDRKNDNAYTIDIINAYNAKADGERLAGDTASANADLNKALAELVTARQKEPDNTELLRSSINIYIQLGRAKEALPLMEESLAKKPEDKELNFNLGILLMQSDNLDEAIPRFEKAISIDPNFEEALRNVSVAYVKQGEKLKQASAASGSKTVDKSYIAKFQSAVKHLEKLTELKKDNPDYWDALATAYANANMIKDANRAMKMADGLRKK